MQTRRPGFPFSLLAAFAVVLSLMAPAANALTARVGSGPTGAAVDFNGYLWVANFGGGSVSKVDTATGVVVNTYTVDAGPIAVIVDAALHDVWVACYTGNSVVHLRASDGMRLGTSPVGAGPRSLVSDFYYIWVANSNDNTVTRLSVADGRPVGSVFHTYPAGPAPYGITYDFHSAIWVANQTGSTVSKLSDATGDLLDTITVAPQPQAVLSDGQSVWVASYSSHTVTRIDVATDNVLSWTDKLPAGPIALALIESSLYVASYGGNRVTRLDFATLDSLNAYSVGGRPYGLAVDHSNFLVPHLWVTKFTDNEAARL